MPRPRPEWGTPTPSPEYKRRWREATEGKSDKQIEAFVAAEHRRNFNEMQANMRSQNIKDWSFIAVVTGFLWLVLDWLGWLW